VSRQPQRIKLPPPLANEANADFSGAVVSHTVTRSARLQWRSSNWSVCEWELRDRKVTHGSKIRPTFTLVERGDVFPTALWYGNPGHLSKNYFASPWIVVAKQNRQAVALVGWQASWWMGVIIGFFLIPAGMLIRNTRDYFIAILRSFFVVLCTTIITGLTALLIAYLVVHAAPTEEFVFRNSAISDPAAIRLAGGIHNFSYFGALLVIFAGLASILRALLAENAGFQISMPASG